MIRLCVGTSLVLGLIPLAAAQRVDMQKVASALGVTCDYCHARDEPNRAQAASHRSTASQMIEMTEEINARVLLATGKEAGQAARIDCASCHRGTPIPRRLEDIMWQTSVRDGADAAIDQYRDLHQRFYGRGVYDFGEETLLTVGRQLANVKPDDALSLIALNLEYYPDSSRSYIALAYAYTRKIDDLSAIAALRKALELDPDNATARGQLEQLESYQRRR